jgi:hypothetical protein
MYHFDAATVCFGNWFIKCEKPAVDLALDYQHRKDTNERHRLIHHAGKRLSKLLCQTIRLMMQMSRLPIQNCPIIKKQKSLIFVGLNTKSIPIDSRF